MNKNDLRVIKTKERIEEAMIELLQSRQLEKITVTELARVARINKGTFYLHYRDILDLYQQVFLKCLAEPFCNATFFSDFFDAPEYFLAELGEAFKTGMGKLHTIRQPNQHEFSYLEEVCEILSKKVYETGRIQKCLQNDIKLNAIFSAVLGIMPKYAAEHGREAHGVLASMIQSQFPKDNGGAG